MIYDIGGWIYWPETQETFTVIGYGSDILKLETISNFYVFINLEKLNGGIESGSMFYIAPKSNLSEFEKEIMVINIKYDGAKISL